MVLMLAVSIPLPAAAADAADEWQEIVARSQAADAEREGRMSPAPAPASAPTARKPPARKPGAHNVTAHAGNARSGASAAAASGQRESGGQAVEVNADAGDMQKAGKARTRAGPAVTIISGGNSSDGAPTVGRLPIMR